MVIKCLYQLLQGEDLLVVGRGPAKQCHIVYNRLGYKALLDQVLEGGVAASLGKLFVELIGDQRAVYINRNLPAKRIVQTVVLRGGGQVLVATYNMGDSH